MPCYSPNQVYFSELENGKKKIFFSNSLNTRFQSGCPSFTIFPENVMSLPCGQCIGCRLEYARQWAVRCVHEASLYEDNCFISLTYSPDELPDGNSLVKKHHQDFLKRLRDRYSGYLIRFFHCGEYGEKFSRPHYHTLLFNFDFKDKVYWKTENGFPVYRSEELDKLWGKGMCVIGSFTFESAGYVARYCTKKVNGFYKNDYYDGRLPEYPTMSLKPGIGYNWYEKWRSDCYPSDFIVVNGVKCKPPRYYDKLLEKDDPVMFNKVKRIRSEKFLDKVSDDFIWNRLKVKEVCQVRRFTKLVRSYERGLYEQEVFA